jgi:hypothetical protein
VLCSRCSSACDLNDNFCRTCGLNVRDDDRLPAVRSSALPVVWRPPVPVVVIKSAAFVVAGTIAEVLVRRLVRNALGKGQAASQTNAITKANGRLGDAAEMESETYLLRRVRIRR